MKTLLIILLLLVLTFSFFAQTTGDIKATTDDGRQVLLKSDGTWIYQAAVNSSESKSDDLATVYFYRIKETNAFNTAQAISIDGTEVFEILQNTFLGVKLKPGEYKFRMRNKDSSEIALSVEPGKTYFVLASRVAGAFTSSFILTETPREQSVFQIRNLKLVEDSKIKKTDYAIVKEKPESK